MLRLRVVAGHYYVVALGKLLTPVCLCRQAVWYWPRGSDALWLWT